MIPAKGRTPVPNSSMIAIVLTLVIATIYADALALVGAALASRAMLGVEFPMFYNSLTSGLLQFGDVAH